MPNKYHRQNFNKGGGADTGRMGEIKSKLAVATDKFKKMEPGGRISKSDLERILKMMDNKKLNLPNTPPPTINSAMEFLKKIEPGNPRFSEKDIKLAKKVLGMKKGGRAKLRFGGKSNLQKIIETFGPKKTKVKKPKKRMMAKGGSKPDFLDLDKDGNTSESMKSAAKQAKGKNND